MVKYNEIESSSEHHAIVFLLSPMPAAETHSIILSLSFKDLKSSFPLLFLKLKYQNTYHYMSKEKKKKKALDN